jgi:hypothetical protein
MPETAAGMCTGGDISLIGGTVIQAGTRVKVLIVSDPSSGDPEADGTEPLKLTAEDIVFWSTVLERSRAALHSRLS